MKNLITFIVYITMSYVLVWVQLYGHSKWEWIKVNGYWFMYLLAIPITYLLCTSTKMAFSYFDGSAWAVTFISFAINIIIFALMNYFINGEGITMKTGLSLMLCLGVLGVQAFMK